MRYVALLRGINVGGQNLIRMADLKRAVEDMGFAEVATLIASGNVLFTARGAAAALEPRLEAGLSKTFGYDARVMVRSRPQLQAVIAGAPRGWPDPKLRCNVIFLKAPLTPKAAAAQVDPRPGVDTVAAGTGVVYVGTRRERLAQSRLSKVVSTPAYKLMTIRTFGTCQKTLARMEG